MPWKQGYTISDERSLADSEVRWPDDARCCVAVTVDLSVASGPEGVTAADLATPEALFGANQGLAAFARGSSPAHDTGDLRGPGGHRTYPLRSSALAHCRGS